MPLYNDRFSGHMELDDPRTVIQGAGGNTWPTCPPYRWAPRTEDAYGLLSYWNTNAAYLTSAATGHEHNQIHWLGVNLPLGCSYFLAGKLWVPSELKINWTIAFIQTFPYALVQKVWQVNPGPGNVDLAIGNMTHPGLPDSGTGDSFRLEQVEWDATAPP